MRISPEMIVDQILTGSRGAAAPNLRNALPESPILQTALPPLREDYVGPAPPPREAELLEDLQ